MKRMFFTAMRSIGSRGDGTFGSGSLPGANLAIDGHGCVMNATTNHLTGAGGHISRG